MILVLASLYRRKSNNNHPILDDSSHPLLDGVNCHPILDDSSHPSYIATRGRSRLRKSALTSSSVSSRTGEVLSSPKRCGMERA